MDTILIKRINSYEAYDKHCLVDVFYQGEIVYLDISDAVTDDGDFLTNEVQAKHPILNDLFEICHSSRFFIYCRKDGMLKNILNDGDYVVFCDAQSLVTDIGVRMTDILEQKNTDSGTTMVEGGITKPDSGESSKAARADHKHGLLEEDLWKTLRLPLDDTDKEDIESSTTAKKVSPITTERLRKITYGADTPDNSTGAVGDIYIKLSQS